LGAVEASGAAGGVGARTSLSANGWIV